MKYPSSLLAAAVALFFASSCRSVTPESPAVQAITQDEIDALQKRWSDFAAAYRPDYSDGADLLQPPKDHRFAEPFAVVKNGRPVAAVRFNEAYAMPPEHTAVKELVDHIKLVTGAELPVNKRIWSKDTPVICIGKSFKGWYDPSPKYRDVFKKLANTDGYAIIRDGRELHVFGATAKGTINGVYALLENNLGLIWARPNSQFGTVYAQQKDLDFVWGDNVLDIPASSVRGCSAFWCAQWLARNRCNSMDAGGGNNYWSHAGSKKYGTTAYFNRGGHNIASFVTPTHPFDKHPELFALINGERKLVANLCFTHPALPDIIAENALDAMRRDPDDIDGLYISLDDTWLWCQCDNCKKDIHLPDGQIVRATDKDFQSTQFYLVFNQVAERLRAEFPRRNLKLLAYFQTVEAPRCPVSDYIVTQYAPYFRVNDKRPLVFPENLVWLRRLEAWRGKSAVITMHGYDALGLAFPKPLNFVHQFDYPLYYRHLQGITNEGTIIQWGDEVGEKHGQCVYWDLSAIELWVLNRLAWNPDQDVEQLYKYFVYRTFREAAKPMQQFYGAIREEWFKNKSTSTIGDNPVSLTKNLIIQPGREKELRGYLADAQKLVVNDNSKAILKRLADRFEFYVSTANGIKTPSAAVPLIRVSETPGFDSACWSSAVSITEFTTFDKTPAAAPHKTDVRLFHDTQKLYIKIIATEDDAQDIRVFKAPEGDCENVGPESHAEIFIGDPEATGDYYLFQLAASGNHADLMKYDKSWNSTWRHSARLNGNAWEAIAVIPLADVHCDIARHAELRATFIRDWYNTRTDAHAYYSWHGGRHHQTLTFGTLKLLK